MCLFVDVEKCLRFGSCDVKSIDLYALIYILIANWAEMKLAP